MRIHWKIATIALLIASLLRADEVGPFAAATPESEGMSSAKLNAMKGNLAAPLSGWDNDLWQIANWYREA